MLFVASRSLCGAIAVWLPVMSVKYASLRLAVRLVASVVLVTVFPGAGVDAAHADPYALSAAPELPDPAYVPSGGGILDDLFGEPSGPYAYYPAPESAAAAPMARQTAYATEETDPENGMARGVIDPAFLRTEVDYRTSEHPGTLVVDTPNRYLYLVQGDGRAILGGA